MNGIACCYSEFAPGRRERRGSKWTANPFIIEEIILFLSVLVRERRTTSIIPVFSPLSGCQSTLWSFEGMRRESGGKGGLFSVLKSPPSSEAKTSRRFNCDSDHPEVTDSHGRSRRTEDEAQARAKIKSQ